MKVLVYMIEGGDLWLSEGSKERIRRRVQEVQGEIFFETDHEKAIREVVDADILFGYITPKMLKNAKRLKWIQAPMASLGTPSGNYFVFPELAESDVVLTNMSGIYNDVIATHVFAFITAIARDLPKLIRSQTQHLWNRNIEAFNLHGKTLGIVGLGGIGREVARIGAAFRMRIVAVEPRPQDVPPIVEKIWGPENLKSLLRESDFVALCLPDAPGTAKLMGDEEFKAMKKTAYLVNIGRGRTVDLEALTRALKNGEIAGVGLDVFQPGFEPLPADHPLWAMENVIITSHVAGHGTPSERRVDVFLENFTRYVSGDGLLNIVDKRRMILAGPGYRLPI